LALNRPRGAKVAQKAPGDGQTAHPSDSRDGDTIKRTVEGRHHSAEECFSKTPHGVVLGTGTTMSVKPSKPATRALQGKESRSLFLNNLDRRSPRLEKMLDRMAASSLRKDPSVTRFLKLPLSQGSMLT